MPLKRHSENLTGDGHQSVLLFSNLRRDSFIPLFLFLGFGFKNNNSMFSATDDLFCCRSLNVNVCVEKIWYL